MLDELVAQVRRLFSSKKNSGKLVYRLTDRLHYYKQVLLATSIVLLIGYSQFRSHFECNGIDKGLDKKILTDHCLMNGTTTLDLKNQQVSSSDSVDQQVSPLQTHVGMNFKLGDDRYELITHNYMRSLWALLILMGACSFVAQRKWASIFEHDILRALLKLPESEKLPIVERVLAAKPYEMLISLPQNKKQHISSDKSSSSGGKEETVEQVFHLIDIITGEGNEYNHTLDYYPNQLLYLLLARRTSAYKLSDLKLRRQILSYSICSLFFTFMQFVLPWLFIGDKYRFYGWEYFKAWLLYTLTLIVNPQSATVNTIDYQLSSRIWPTSTQCEYSQFGYQGIETNIVQCTAPINEICGKIFVIIWWFIAINIVIELYSTSVTVICSLNFKTTEWCFGHKYWPKAISQAHTIATFRYKHANLLNAKLKSNQEAIKEKVDNEAEDSRTERERKQLEAEGDKVASDCSISDKKWYLWCTRDVGLLLAKQGKKLGTKQGKNWITKSKTSKDEDGFREVKQDTRMYYLLYLLYLRLNRSDKKIEQIIKMTSDALNKYLNSLNDMKELPINFEQINDETKGETRNISETIVDVESESILT